MKVLLDACVWGHVQVALSANGHDVIWVGDWDADPGDEEILGRAFAEGRILVTLDKDFGELAIIRGMPHHGILRIVGFSARQQAAVCLSVLNSHGTQLESGAIITAAPGRLRIREG
ncbi:MAG: toxin-antitoxin system, toxin component, PIN family protein [Acidobacteria bacterium]|nr:MAG: toxin-antitoxin system, toxin component, PIN family protein [Acidobacteriota bacterium]